MWRCKRCSTRSRFRRPRSCVSFKSATPPLAGVLVVLAMLTTTMAEPKCLTLREARAMWPGVHLHWYRDHERRRCWSNSRGPNTARVVRIRGGDRTTETESTPPPPSTLPLSAAAVELMAELMRKPPEPPASYPDVSAWDAFIANVVEPEVVYSTFAGEVPDEWPIDKPSSPWSWLGGAFTAVLAAFFWFARRGFLGRAACGSVFRKATSRSVARLITRVKVASARTN